MNGRQACLPTQGIAAYNLQLKIQVSHSNRLYGNNGKENGNYYNIIHDKGVIQGIYWGFMGIMEKTMPWRCTCYQVFHTHPVFLLQRIAVRTAVKQLSPAEFL